MLLDCLHQELAAEREMDLVLKTLQQRQCKSRSQSSLLKSPGRCCPLSPGSSPFSRAPRARRCHKAQTVCCSLVQAAAAQAGVCRLECQATVHASECRSHVTSQLSTLQASLRDPASSIPKALTDKEVEAALQSSEYRTQVVSHLRDREASLRDSESLLPKALTEKVREEASRDSGPPTAETLTERVGEANTATDTLEETIAHLEPLEANLDAVCGSSPHSRGSISSPCNPVRTKGVASPLSRCASRSAVSSPVAQRPPNRACVMSRHRSSVRQLWTWEEEMRPHMRRACTTNKGRPTLSPRK